MNRPSIVLGDGMDGLMSLPLAVATCWLDEARPLDFALLDFGFVSFLFLVTRESSGVVAFRRRGSWPVIEFRNLK